MDKFLKKKGNIMAKNNKKKNRKDNKYNAENEIIIGVTTKPKEKVRVENKKTTRTNNKSSQNKKISVNSKTIKKEVNNQKIQKKKNVLNKKKVQAKSTKTNINNKVYNNEITKEEQIKRINKKKIIVSIVILLFIALGGTIYYLTTPVFNIENIEVYGNNKNSVDTYISLSKIDIGTKNIFAVTSNGIKKNIKENAYVEDVSIERKLPNTIKIHITERVESYQIKYTDKYIYLDSQGHILEITEEKKDLPVINGFSSIKESMQLGQRLIEEDLIKLNVVAKFMNYCKYNNIENKVTDIDVKDDTNYIIEFKEDKKTLYLGDASNLSERLVLLKKILSNEKNKKIEIFMDGDPNKDDVYIRYVEK